MTEWNLPRTFDYAQRNLGIGEFIGEPDEYGPWRVKQMGILKRLMSYRKVSFEEVVMCVDYCKAHHIQPEQMPGLLQHMDPARRWHKEQQLGAIDNDLQDAISYEHSLSDEASTSWLGQLLRVKPQNVEEVLAEWRLARSVK